MEYTLKVNNDEVVVHGHDQQDAQLSIDIGGCKYKVGYTSISENRLHLNVEKDGVTQALNVYLAQSDSGKMIGINGSYFELYDVDSISDQKRRKGSSTLPNIVTPPIPSVVVAIMVNTGDEVQKGQEVVVLSAMKMETTLVAPFKGLVVAVNAVEGDKVSPGDILVDIEKSETEVAD